MKNFAVIGDPIEHSLSPVLHNWVYKSLNIEATYSKIHATKNKLADWKDNAINDFCQVLAHGGLHNLKCFNT